MADIEKPLTAEEIAALEVRSDVNKEKKYDRQIRLWGLHGQNRLSKTHVVLLGAGPSGSETVKNLVLPGIGKISVVDGEKVTNRDLGNNFFVELSGVGKPRVEEVGRLLLELNPFVDKGSFIDMDPHVAVSSNAEFVRDYDIIIANNLSENTIKLLGEQCCKWHKKLITLTSNGMIGMVKIFATEHRVLESKPDGEKWDLRISSPWPELQEFADSFDLDAMKADLKTRSGEFTHTPFPVILMKLLAQWKASKGGELPKTNDDKDAFTASIRALGGGLSVADNFREAVANKYLSYVPYEIPSETKEILDDEKCKNITESSGQFWLLAAAVKKFVENEGNGFLPLVGALPDITAKPATYIQMQKLYQAKAAKDAAVVKGYLGELLKSVNKTEDAILDEKIALFCKHSNVMRVFRFPSPQDEFNPEKALKENVVWFDATGSGDPHPVGRWYLALRAASLFQTEHGRLPGDRNDKPEADFENFKKCQQKILEDMDLLDDELEIDMDPFLKELIRFGGSQIHNTAAFIGGVASQEITKLIVKQWSPIDNTFVYSGITGASVFFSI